MLAGNLPATLIRPPQGWAALELRELWGYRDLLFLFVWRDLKIRYKQTFLGIAWAVLNPFIAMVVFTFLFGHVARVPSEGIPYPVFAYSALIPWTYFVTTLTQSTDSVVKHSALVSAVYFPRLILPLSSVVPGLVDLAIAFVMLIVLMLFYGVMPTAALWTLPFFILLAMATALAGGLWASALNVEYRDVGFVVVPFLTQLGLFVTPVAYSSSLVPEPWRIVYSLNPMVGVVEGFRWALLGKAPPSGTLLLVSVLAVVGLLVSGLYYFRWKEETFADVV
ncbi:MAG: ABC transporter permease [Candidatus Binatia bacterium]